MGHAVPFPEPGPDRSSPSGPGRIPSRGPIPLPRSSESRREQAQGVPSAYRSHSARFHVRHTSQIRVVATSNSAG